ncbi:MAG: GNAT family N-acetyltransferase [Myxococcota bacterium]
MDLGERQPALEFGHRRVVARDARPEEHRSVCDVLGRAFADDPVAEYLFPDPATRAERYAGFAGIAITAFASAAVVTTEPELRCGAIWQAPTHATLGPLRQLRLLASLVGLTRSGFGRAARLGELMSRHHPRERHWYLAVLGTDPSAQRRGLASAVLQPVLERADRERLPAYLESSKAANIPFYNKHGFEVVDELRVPDGPSLWPMIRRTG